MCRQGGLLVAMLVLLAGCQPGSELPVVYRDLEAGFAVTLPAGWQLMRGYGDVDLIASPPGASSMATRVAVQRDQRKNGEAVDLDHYAQFRLARIAHFAQKRELLDQTRMPLNDQLSDAMRLDYRYQMRGDQRVRTRAWLLVSDQGQYTVSLSAPEGEFDRYEQAWEQFQATFELLAAAGT